MMVRQYHLLRSTTTQGTPEGLLTDGYGGFFLLDTPTNYRGWHIFDSTTQQMRKIIDSIQPLHEGSVTSITYTPYSLTRHFKSGATDTFILYGHSMLYETYNISREVLLTLDHRLIYESSRLGRHFTLSQEPSNTRISFKQLQQDSSTQYTSELYIKGLTSISKKECWREQHYPLDKNRNAQSSYWVYDAITFIPQRRVVFSIAQQRHRAKVINDVAYHHFDSIRSQLHCFKQQQLQHNDSLSTQQQTAFDSATLSLLSLFQHVYPSQHTSSKSLLAGLPWFFQVWSRDELISMGGLIALAKNNSYLWKDIISRLDSYTQTILDSGIIPNMFFHSGNATADAPGWFAKRVADSISALQSSQELFIHCTSDQLFKWHNALELLLENEKNKRLQQDFIQETSLFKTGLFYSKSGETWMDTPQDGGREGYRIEIQALFDTLYSTLITLKSLLSLDTALLKKERLAFQSMVSNYFIDTNSKVIIDGLDSNGNADFRIRPNIFIAYYCSQELFSTKQWKRSFDSILHQLFLTWGGVASLDPSDPAFENTYTGEQDTSYHHGDSWYFLNNITALVLSTFKKSFSTYIEKILSASTHELLELGVGGHASEVSSANSCQGQGSLAQAWSASSYIELITSLYN
ncbi:MAG: amylo-alpha-1,6-glucosidase [Nanobdellota archaeon]